MNSKTGRIHRYRCDFKIGDLVRYKQGILDYIGVVVDDMNAWGDYEILFSRTGKKGLCGWRYLELLS